MPHIALVGDSIFDNAAYVDGGPDVAAQLRDELGADWRVTLLAIDGAVTTDVAVQMERLADEVTHLLLSVGGNDALGHHAVLMQDVSVIGEGEILLGKLTAEFEASYRRAVERVLEPGLPLALCTIYNPNFDDAFEQAATVAALCHFNDTILRIAFEHALPVIDLRLVCDDPADYANPIEPSVQGGQKIAHCIRVLLEKQPWGNRQVFTGK